MTPPAVAQALADLRAVYVAASAAVMPGADAAAVLDRLIIHATAAARAQTPFAIEMDLLATETGRSHAAVAHAVADLMSAGWLALDAAGRWYPAIAPHVPAVLPAVPAPEQS